MKIILKQTALYEEKYVYHKNGETVLKNIVSLFF